MTDFAAQERDPLTRGSKARRERNCRSTARYHSIIERGWWVYCGCGPDIPGLPDLRMRSRRWRKHNRWAGR